MQGVFHLSRTNYLEGSVTLPDTDREPVLIQGLQALNRAVDGDTVAVELLNKADWAAPAPLVLQDEGFDPGDSLEGEERLLAGAGGSNEPVQCTGKVVGVVR